MHEHLIGLIRWRRSHSHKSRLAEKHSGNGNPLCELRILLCNFPLVRLSLPASTTITMRAHKRVKLQLQHRTPSPDSDADNTPLPTVLFRNTQLASPGGSRKASTSYLPTLGSPTKPTRNREDDQWDDSEVPPAPSHPGDIDVEQYPFLDPAYIHQCEMDDPVRTRRRRTTASVSHSSHLTCFFFLITFCRIIPCSTGATARLLSC